MLPTEEVFFLAVTVFHYGRESVTVSSDALDSISLMETAAWVMPRTYSGDSTRNRV